MPGSRKAERIVRRETDITKLTRAFEMALMKADAEKTTGEIVCRVKLNLGGICQNSLQVVEDIKTF